MSITTRLSELVTGLSAGCAGCGGGVDEHTSRYWHRDQGAPVLLCYPCFEERRRQLALAPAGQDQYMQEILAHETAGESPAENGANWVTEAAPALEVEPELEPEEPEPDPTPCPECGGPRIVANVRGDFRLAYRESLLGLGLMSNTRVYALVCRRCGLTNLYAYDPAAVFPPGDYD